MARIITQAEFQAVVDERDNLLKAVESETDATNLMRADRDVVAVERDEAEVKYESLLHSYRMLEMAVDIASQRYDEVKIRHDALIRGYAEYKVEIARLEVALQIAQNELARVTEELAKCRIDCEHLLEPLEDHLEIVTKESTKSMRDSIVALEATNKQLQHELDMVSTKEHATLRADNRHLRDDNERLSNRYDNSCRDRDHKRAVINGANRENAGLREENEELDRRMTRANEQVVAFSVVITKLQGETKQSHDSFAQLNTVCSINQTLLDGRLEEIETLNTDRERLRTKVNQLISDVNEVGGKHNALVIENSRLSDVISGVVDGPTADEITRLKVQMTTSERTMTDRLDVADAYAKRLTLAATALYRAGFWSCDRLLPDKSAGKLWEDLRDAIGMPLGKAPVRVIELTPQQSQDAIDAATAAMATIPNPNPDPYESPVALHYCDECQSHINPFNLECRHEGYRTWLSNLKQEWYCSACERIRSDTEVENNGGTLLQCVDCKILVEAQAMPFCFQCQEYASHADKPCACGTCGGPLFDAEEL